MRADRAITVTLPRDKAVKLADYLYEADTDGHVEVEAFYNVVQAELDRCDCGD
jgi:hypothetical protein